MLRTILLLTLWLVTWPAQAAELQAGAATVDITPPSGFPLWGYAARHDARCEGVLDPLKARALVLSVGDEHLALVSLDLGRAPTRQSTESIRAKVKAAVGLEHLFLVASHTHHGPVLELDNWPTPEKSYVRTLEQKLAELIITAYRARRPARYGVASRELSFNHNRQSRRQEKPVDRTFLVLRVEDRDGKPLAHAVNFAAHPTMTDGKVLKFSADYPGALAELVEQETGVPCLFLQGAAGDLSPSAGQENGPRAFGQRLGKEVLELSRGIRCSDGEHTLQVRNEEFRFKARLDVGHPVVKLALSRAFFPAIIDFYEREYREGVRPQLQVALLDGRIGLVGVSGEFFCDHALQLRRRARLDHLFFLGYCNDYQQYFPTLEAAAEGGYGTEPPVSQAEFGAGEQMMNRALLHLYQLRGKLREIPSVKVE
jgi:neutral ceramidase